MILDAHLHLWDRDRFDYPWMDGHPKLPRTSLPADVDDSCFIAVEAGVSPQRTAAEVAWIESLAQDCPRIRGIVAAVDLLSPTLPTTLDRLAEHPLVVGVRDNFEGRIRGELDTDASSIGRRLMSGILAARARGLRVDLCIRFEQMNELRTLLTAIADSVGDASGIVLDHLGKPLPQLGRDHLAAWQESIAGLAALPLLHTKLSGVPGQFPGTVTPATAAAAATDVTGPLLDVFGPDRLMYGSDHPVSTSGHGLTRDDWKAAVTSAVTDLGAEGDLDRVMGLTAARFYGMDANE